MRATRAFLHVFPEGPIRGARGGALEGGAFSFTLASNPNERTQGKDLHLSPEIEDVSMNQRVILFAFALLTATIVEAAVIETELGYVDIPPYEDFVDAPAEVKAGIQESQRNMGSDSTVLFVRVKPSESHRGNNYSEMLALSCDPKPSARDAAELKVLANNEYQQVKQIMVANRPGVSLGQLVVTDHYFLTPVDMEILDPSFQKTTLRTINGTARIGGNTFPFSALIVAESRTKRDLFTAKIQAWIELACANNTQHLIQKPTTSSEGETQRTISPFGTFVLTPHFEQRGGAYGEISSSVMQSAHVPMARFVLQQKGLNEGSKEAFSHYARMLQDSTSVDLNRYSSKPAGQYIDITENNDPVGLLVLGGLGTSKLLGIEVSEICFFGGKKSVKVVLRRQSGTNPPVRVTTFLTPLGSTTVQTVFSYRISDSIDWASEIDTIVNSFEFNEN